MLSSTRVWLGKPAAERKHLLFQRFLRVAPWTRMTFGVGLARLANIYWAYHPDSHVAARDHAEFDHLFARFIRHNRLNNAGDTARLWSFILNIKQVLDAAIEGDFAELGVWRGNTAAVLAHFARPEPSAAELAAPSSAEGEYFFIKSGRMLHKVLLKDILYFEGEKEYARLVTPVQKLLIYRRLKDIEEQLSASFARVHNSYIINIARLDSIRDNHVFIGAKQIPISEKFREAFMNRIKERVF